MATEKKTTKEASRLDLNKVYSIEVLKNGKHLRKGDTYEVSGDVANVLINKGLAKVK